MTRRKGRPWDWTDETSLHKGARFGPRAIRQASSRQTSFRGFNPRADINPYRSWARVLDCGDVPVTPMDNAVALVQMTEAFVELGSRTPASPHLLARPAAHHPRRRPQHRPAGAAGAEPDLRRASARAAL